MDKQTGKLMKLDAAEYALYAAGIRRGHGECLRQMAGQLRAAAAASGSNSSAEDGKQEEQAPEGGNGEVSGYVRFAVQLEEPARLALEEQAKLLDQFERARAERRRTVTERLLAAWQGALGGWRDG